MIFECIEVKTRDYYQGAQEPYAFRWREMHYYINEIIDRWYEGYIDPSRLPLRYYKVKTDDGQTVTLRYHAFFDAWSILVPAKQP